MAERPNCPKCGEKIVAPKGLSASAVARILGVSPNKILEWCNSGKVKHEVVHWPKQRRLYISASEVKRLKRWIHYRKANRRP